jgi:hypothetical protein
VAESNVVRVKFGDSASQKLIDEIRAVVMKPEYDEVKCSELYGILFMLMQEFYARQQD